MPQVVASSRNRGTLPLGDLACKPLPCRCPASIQSLFLFTLRRLCPAAAG